MNTLTVNPVAVGVVLTVAPTNAPPPTAPESENNVNCTWGADPVGNGGLKVTV